MIRMMMMMTATEAKKKNLGINLFSSNLRGEKEEEEEGDSTDRVSELIRCNK